MNPNREFKKLKEPVKPEFMSKFKLKVWMCRDCGKAKSILARESPSTVACRRCGSNKWNICK